MAKPTISIQRGVAAVEFALILPFLLILSFLTTEFGRALYQYNSMAKAVRDGARYLSVQTPGTHLTESANLIVYGNTQGTGNPLIAGLTTAHVQTPVWSTAGTDPVINTVTVRISGFQFDAMFSGFFGINFPPITFSDITATMRSHL